MPNYRFSISIVVSGLLILCLPGNAYAAQPPVGLGTATSFSVLAGTTVTNVGPSVISGDLDLSPGSDVAGFPPGLVINGTQHVTNALALQAQNDLTTAFNDAAGRTPAVDQTGQDLGGQTLVAGVYKSAEAMSLTGTVTLDAQGDPNAVFIFQAGSTLLTASSSTVALVGAAQACNVFWQVGSSATLGTATTFVGSIMALTSATLQTGATVEGRVLARNGQVSLDTNVITRPLCDTTTPPPVLDDREEVTAGGGGGGSTQETLGSDSFANPSAGGGSGAGNGSGNGAGGSNGSDGPVIPPGHPATGLTPAGSQRENAWLFAGVVALVISGGAGIVGTSRRHLRPTHAR